MSDAYFSGSLDLRAYKAGEWVLLEDFKYHSKAGVDYVVPKWFISDLASTPWIVEPLLNAEDRPAGVVHDWLYCSQIVSQAEADALFREMLETLGWGVVRRNAMYSGLRIGGWYRYGQCKGGPKHEDFAWEYIASKDIGAYAARIGI